MNNDASSGKAPALSSNPAGDHERAFRKPIKFHISDENSDATELATFFHRNLEISYISHSELQGPRAIRVGVWSSDILSVLRDEIQDRLLRPRDNFPLNDEWKGVIEARHGRKLIAVALITVCRSARKPFSIVEDVVVDKALRGSGIGEQLMRWIIGKCKEVAIYRLFLESGVENKAAHSFFCRLGFREVSIVMMYDSCDD